MTDNTQQTLEGVFRIVFGMTIMTLAVLLIIIAAEEPHPPVVLGVGVALMALLMLLIGADLAWNTPPVIRGEAK